MFTCLFRWLVFCIRRNIKHYIKHVLSFITIFKTLYTLIWALPWVKNRWKFSSDAKKIPYGISVQEKVVKKDINGEYSGSHSIRTSEGSLYKSLGKKSSKKFYSTSKYAPLHDEEVLDTGENKQVFRISYHKEHKHRVSQKDQSQSFVSQGIYSSPLAIPTDGNERYPKIAGKHGFKAVKKSKVSKFFKKIVCFPCFPKKKTYLDSENSKNMHLFSHAMSPIMSPIMLPTISPLPLSPVSLSSLNDEQKVKELPQKKYDYLFMGNIWVPGQDGFGLVIELSDWISDKLSIRTRQRLANELKRSISTHDKPGYIYVFNLQSSDKIKPYSLEKMFIKIGRASNIQRRLNQWPKQCSFIPELIEYFPSDQDGPKHCLVTYRIERLIHIELQDRFLCKPQTCIPCGISHREWFYIPNFNTWNEVKQTIEKWVMFSFIAYGKI